MVSCLLTVGISTWIDDDDDSNNNFRIKLSLATFDSASGKMSIFYYWELCGQRFNGDSFP